MSGRLGLTSGLEIDMRFGVEKSEREGVAPFMTVDDDQENDTSWVVRDGR